MSEVECEHCGRSLMVSERVVDLADEHADGEIVCGACEGMQELPDNIPECDRSDCSKSAPFVIETTAGNIRRCRSCLVVDLTEREWFEFYDGDSI